jgi:cell division protein FtsW (lipid II flippase)
VAVNGRWRAYAKYAWTILFVSALLGIFGGVILLFPKDATSLSPIDVWVRRAWAITWMEFNTLVLALSVGPYRRGERWAWYTLWLMPLLFVGYFFIAPEAVYLYLGLAVLSALGLILPYRRYFSDTEQRRSRARSTPEDPFPPGYFDE